MRTGILSLSGYNVRAVVALARWAAAVGVPLHLVARSAADPLYQTAYVDRIFVQREHAELSLDELLGWIATLRTAHGYERVVLAPSTEFFNRFALAHRATLEAAGALLPLVDDALYRRISDKESFAALCSDHGIDVPRAMDEPPTAGAFVAKPRHYAASRVGRIKPYLVHDAAERHRFMQAEAVEAYFYQEYVAGASLYLLLHVARSGAVTVTSQENLLQQRDGGSVILARSSHFHRHPLAQRYVSMLRAVHFHGLVMIEVRRCSRTGRHVMIEANPRLWGPLQFTLDTGVDLLTPWWTDAGPEFAITPFELEPLHDYYFWSGGMSAAGQPIMRHEYSADEFVADYARIAASDLFARPDTAALHRAELLSLPPA